MLKQSGRHVNVHIAAKRASLFILIIFRKISDLPAFGNKVCIHLKTRKFYCYNPKCDRRVFAERFDTHFTRYKQSSDLTAFGEYDNISRACRKTKVPRRNIYDWLKSDPEFEKAFEEVRDIALGALEDEAVRRAHEGVLKPVFYKGDKCGDIREYSDTLLIVLLKARTPEKYKDRVQQEHSGKNGAPIDLSFSNLPNVSTEDLLKILDEK